MYNQEEMVITKSEPFTKEEIEKLKQKFEVYVKTVVDIERKICIAGMSIHADGEKLLLDKGSIQLDIWGGGIDTVTKVIDYNSFINIRPNSGNMSNEILDENIRSRYKELTEYFFTEML